MQLIETHQTKDPYQEETMRRILDKPIPDEHLEEQYTPADDRLQQIGAKERIIKATRSFV